MLTPAGSLTCARKQSTTTVALPIWIEEPGVAMQATADAVAVPVAVALALAPAVTDAVALAVVVTARDGDEDGVPVAAGAGFREQAISSSEITSARAGRKIRVGRDRIGRVRCRIVRRDESYPQV